MPPPPFDAGALAARYAAIEADVLRGFADGPRTITETARRDARVARQQAAALKRALGEHLKTFARTLGFAVVVPGTHAGGISNQALFDLLAAQGRDFGANTRRLRDHVKIALLDAFEGEPIVPLVFEVQRVAAEAVLEFVAARLDGQVTDVRLAPLSPEYRKAKRRAGYGGRPGTRTGALRDAVLGHGRVVLA